ncbi:MAG: tetratricopeptide repeat protein, partial [Chloroflexota bacterium]|nr:tetratricopeptide repeat protein [Chloroflexota bacterium]
EILQRAPGVKFLITSRQRLNTQWEWLLEVAGLEETSATQLFRLRARTLDAHFAAPSATASETGQAIVQICRLVQGLPLGIELAAASIRHYSCAEIAAAIAHNFDLLSSGLRDVPARHRSVRAVFDYSWQQLSAPEQQIFAVLAVFAGSFAQPAALAVCQNVGMTQISGSMPKAQLPLLLAGLVDKSLVQRRKDGRYQLHELLRQYAAEKLALEGTRHAAAQRTHARFYANFLAQQGAEIGSSRQRAGLSGVEAEIDNVRAAWNWAVAHEPAQELLPMIDSLFEFYEVRGLVQEAGERFGAALAAVEQAGSASPADNLTLIKLLNRQARFLFRQGHQAEAESLLRRSLALTERVDHVGERALTCNYLGLVQQWAGDYGEAVRFYQASLTLYQGADDKTGMARALNNLGIIRLRMGDYTDAEAFLQQSLVLRRQLGDAKSIADSLNNLGILRHQLGEYEGETQLLQEALETYRQMADRRGIGVILHNLGGVHLACARYAEARRLLEEALDYRQNEPTSLGHTLNNLGTVAFQSGDRQEAGDYYGRALQVTWESKAIPQTLDILVGIAECLLHDNKPTPALDLLAFVRHQTHDSDTLTEIDRLLAPARAAAAPIAAQAEATGAARTIEQSVAMALQALG